MQQITRGDYLKDLITIYIENNLQTDITELYNQFIFQCGEIQKVLTPAQVIKISFNEIESQLLKSTNTCYLAGITVDGHKETFNGSLTFNTRGEVVFYEPTVSTVTPAATETTCDCQGLRGFFSNCTQPAIKAYFSLNYVPTKLSELQNDTDFVDSVDVAESISIHNASTDAHPYIQSALASATEALTVSIQAETTAREEAVSLAISTTEAYADSIVTQATEATRAYADSIVSTATTATEAYTDSVLQSATTAINTTIGDLSQLDTSVKSSVTNAINSEVSARQSADNNLQGQIDALAAASDVTDIVGTYAELQAYDTQHLNDNDIIKVLSDSTHQDQPSYYRFDKETDTFSYIGSEDAGYTKAQADAKFVTQTTTINGEALSQNITLTATEVGALPSTTTINDLTTTAQQNALNSGVTSAVVSQVATNTTNIASNTSAISTINGKIPTDASSSNKLVSASTLSASIADFANQDLSNLTSNGEGRLHALKSYADEGELLTDPDGLAFVQKYARSTFDLSKFTVNGTTGLTSDGIIPQGLYGSNTVRPNYLLPLWNNEPWEIITPLYTISPTGSDTHTMLRYLQPFYYEPAQADRDDGINLNYMNGTASVSIIFDAYYGTGSSNRDTITGSIQKPISNPLQFKMVHTGTQYELYYRGNGFGAWTLLGTQVRNHNFTNTHTQKMYISWFSNATYTMQGSTDLKYMSTKDNGAETFNACKTGIDTIKPDDYTVVGTPTISADGVLKNADVNNNIKTPTINFSSANTWEYIVPVDIKSNLTTDCELLYIPNPLLTVFRINQSRSVYLYITTGGSAQSGTTSGVVPFGKGYVKLAYEGTGYNVYYSTNCKSWQNLNISALPSFSNKLQLNGSFYIGGGQNVAHILTDSEINIDLNGIKTIFDGNLVYQPCLKIPYTESKAGSKIVNAIYRDRVNDMAEQFGFANYYTLSDTDFTLPQVELYGLIGQRTLRDSYRNGINYWELYSNRDLEQGGSCTSGVEVTFLRPFADTNYVLSVPYSAKSSTAFTPTQTGDWIAKGKGIL